MIDRSEVLTIAGERNLRVDMIEKDYVLGWMLAGIFAHPALGPAWVFKGGTCLKKCFLETYRLSEDLDFTVEDTSQLDEGVLADAFQEIADWMYDQSGIDISSQRPRFRAYRNARGGLQIEGRIYYRGPMQPRGSLPRVKLDLTADERMVPPVDRAVAHPYSDSPQDGITTRTYPLTELMGEKIRALGERARPRDLYDVISLFRRDDLRPEASAVLQTLREKCEFKDIPVPDIASLQPFREEYGGRLGSHARTPAARGASHRIPLVSHSGVLRMAPRNRCLFLACRDSHWLGRGSSERIVNEPGPSAPFRKFCGSGRVGPGWHRP